jgi:hypothetical protein
MNSHPRSGTETSWEHEPPPQERHSQGNGIPGSPAASAIVLSVQRSDRWQIWQRLQDLGISCDCVQDGTLRVNAGSALIATQVWSVTWRQSASRQQLVEWLCYCWQVS